MRNFIWSAIKKLESYSGYSPFIHCLNHHTGRNITVAGMECTGSTFIYQVIKEIGASTLKIHHYVNDNRMKFVTYRDPRDIICSYARRQLNHISKSGGLEAGLLSSHRKLFCEFKRHEDLRQYRDDKRAILLKYEKYFNGNEMELVTSLVEHLQLKMSYSKKNRLINKYSIQSNKLRSNKFKSFQDYDNETHIHGNHISSGGRTGVWRELFTHKVCEKIKKDLGYFLIEFGYEKNMEWKIG